MEAGEESRAQDSPLPFSYRLVRRFYRFLTGVWFREVNVVDDEHLPPEGGRLYITWHPSGLIDPMLMTAVLPGQLTTVAKHTLFRVPFLGRLLKLSGVVPVERANDTSDPDGARQRNAERLAGLASGLARGKDVLIFPEGSTHSDSGFDAFGREPLESFWRRCGKPMLQGSHDLTSFLSASTTQRRNASASVQPL